MIIGYLPRAKVFSFVVESYSNEKLDKSKGGKT